MIALVADDSSTIRRIMAGVLRHDCGFDSVDQVSNGREAVEAVTQKRYDLVMLDWNMPELEGIDALRKIRESGSKVPVIMVTAVRERENVMAAFAAGANNYMVKPVVPATVKEKVKQTLEAAEAKRQSKRSLAALIADDSAIVRRILVGALKEHCGFAEVVETEDGAQALEATRQRKFDLILLDWNMPNMLGIDALRAIRGDGVKTPVVMVTSEKEGARVVEAFDAGADNYVIKPFQPSTVADKVRQVLHLH